MLEHTKNIHCKSDEVMVNDPVNTVNIRVIERLDVTEAKPLLAASHAEGLQFVERLVNEYCNGANRFQLDGETLLGAYTEKLIGVCGLNRDPFAVGVGRLRHLYVLPAFRRQGVGRMLVQAALQTARHFFQRVRLRTNNPVAARFYADLGFLPIDDPHATHIIQP